MMLLAPDGLLVNSNRQVTYRVSVYAENQLLKLPSNKFTVREREMLMGTGILPPEFFQATKNPFVIGLGVCECHPCMSYCPFGRNDVVQPAEYSADLLCHMHICILRGVLLILSVYVGCQMV